MAEKILWEADVECTSCGGTGLYTGMCECHDAAVICIYCEGTGKQHIKHEYTPFVKRVHTSKVKRVYKTAGGYGISAKDEKTEDGRIIHFSQVGVSYENWLKGDKPLPIYELHCPLEHFDQCSEIGGFLKDEGPCEMHIKWGDSISECSEKRREKCWEWFEKSKYSKEY